MHSLSIIIPTFNEAESIINLLIEIESIMEESQAFEIIVVDDNSPDNTYEIIQNYILDNNKLFISVIKRTWSKGLSSAVIEGSALAKFSYIAVMDGDGQHDPNDLKMLFREMLKSNKDIAIGSRFLNSKNSDSLSKKRNLISIVGNSFSSLILKKKLSDPLSGFFVVKSSLLKNNSKKLYKEGFKILFDILMISKNASVLERQINFRERSAGTSKLNFSTVLSLIGQILENYTYRIFPSSFFVFSFIGSFGVLIHLSILYSMLAISMGYIHANFIGTIGALISNYFLNNFFTFNNLHRTSKERLKGLVRYAIVNSLSILANIGIAAQLYIQEFSILLSTAAGIFAGIILNYLLRKNLVFKN